MNKIRVLKIISFVNSILIVWPVTYVSLYFHNFDFGLLLFMGNNFSDLGGAVFAFVTLLFSLILVISNSIIGAYLFRKTKEKKYISLCFVAGLFFFPVFILLDFAKTKFNFSHKSKKAIAITSTGSIAAFSVASFGMGIFGVAEMQRNYIVDKESGDVSGFEFSLDERKPNVIEMFSDGLDFNYFSEAMSESSWNSLSDFTFYPKFVEKGFFTVDSEHRLFVGDDDYMNQFKISHKRVDEHKFYFEASGYNNDSSQENHIGNTNTGDTKTFEGNWSGNWESFKNDFPNVNTLNWTRANKMLGNKYKSDYMPEYSPYAAFINKAKAGKPSYSELSDTITHGPYHISEDGGYKFFGSPEDSFKAVINFLTSLKEKLSSIYDPTNPSYNAYDNTTIIIYGDHGSHEIETPSVNLAPSDTRRKNQSALFVKPLKRFIKTSKPKNVNFDREIPSIFLRRIVKTALLGDENGNPLSPVDFINTNKNFDSGRVFSTFYLGHEWFSKYDSSNILQPLNNKKLINGWTEANSEIYKELIVGEKWK